jgi:hypothetical protein
MVQELTRAGCLVRPHARNNAQPSDTDRPRRHVALRSATPSFIDANARGLLCTEEVSTAWYLRITLIREMSWTCPADEYLRVQY